MIKIRVMRLDQECDASFDIQCLCPADRKRWSEMQSIASRKRFLSSRKILYRVLSKETGLDQSALSIGLGHFGKPYLQKLPRFFDFSLSHCRDFQVIATSLICNVGVDIEDRPWRGPMPSLEAVCSADELRRISAAHEVDFLALWTRKEAFLKLNGVGLSIDPKEIDTLEGGAVFYSGEIPLLCKVADVLTYTSDGRYVLSVAYPQSGVGEETIEFMIES